jgi:hypothetical protein
MLRHESSQTSGQKVWKVANLRGSDTWKEWSECAGLRGTFGGGWKDVPEIRVYKKINKEATGCELNFLFSLQH